MPFPAFNKFAITLCLIANGAGVGIGVSDEAGEGIGLKSDV